MAYGSFINLLNYTFSPNCLCGICGEQLSGDVYSVREEYYYHTRCVISYWEKLDKTKLKYRSIREKYIQIYIKIYQSLQEKSIKKYGKILAELDSVSINEFIKENSEEVQELEFFLREINFQESKKKMLRTRSNSLTKLFNFL